MTVGELIVFNSTIATGAGTVLQHLSNINSVREVFSTIDVAITGLDINVNLVEEVLTIDFIEGAVL